MIGGIFHSEPMMGFSIDNITPSTPTGLLAAQSGNYIEQRDEMDIEDFNYFSIYRSENSGFEINDAHLIGYAISPMLIDSTVAPLTSYYYKINATDYSGNTGLESNSVEGFVNINLAQ